MLSTEKKLGRESNVFEIGMVPGKCGDLEVLTLQYHRWRGKLAIGGDNIKLQLGVGIRDLGPGLCCMVEKTVLGALRLTIG
jgi:hypothetical protein